jgi:ATP-dependent helicase/nuclease subunit B
MTDIFSATLRIFSLSPSTAYLDEVARGLVDATGAKANPEALADTLIFTPNQRAARELSVALYRAVGGTLLTPEIRTLGDIEEEDGLAAFGPDALDLPPAITPAQRRGALSRLIQHWRTAAGGDALPPGALLSAADELAALIDQSWMAGGVDWKKLDGLAEELAPQLAAHWRSSADFLDIVMRAWPKHLKEQGLCDAQMRRLGAAEALATRWARTPPAHPVLVVGSTGAGAATRILMQAVLDLPKGVIVLPGLDPDSASEDWKAISESASHPQYVLHATLQWLRIAPGAVRTWPADAEAPSATARRRLLNQALAPATRTSDWTKRLAELAHPESPAAFVASALEDLRLIEAEDENEEALAAALLLRETLETPGKTAALVTPESSLARRVAAILERWGIDIAPSSGAPLAHSETGSLISLLSRWVFDPSDSVHLLAVLKHPHVRVGRDQQALSGIVTRIDHHSLRGPRKHRTLEALASFIADPPQPDDPDRPGQKPDPEGAALIRDLAILFNGVAHAFPAQDFNGPAAADGVAQLAEALAEAPGHSGNRIWSGKPGEMAARFIGQLRDLSGAIADMTAQDFPDFVAAAIRGLTSAPDTPEHPRIVIWGPLEARLQRRDRMILASLNEGSWPKPVAADAFLNRKLRSDLGLPDPDERIGLSAHDFAQLANAPEVILLRARRVDDKPAVASRWLWRLRTLAAGGLRGRKEAEAALRAAPDHDPLLWGRALRYADRVTSAKPPAPRPPVEKRKLTRFSPTRVTTLIRDPYADYAQRILNLERLRRAGEPIDARERGTAVHKAIELFETPGNMRELGELIFERLLDAGAAPELAELERPLWLRAAAVYHDWMKDRGDRVIRAVLEKKAEIEFDSAAPGGKTKIRATADRVELLKGDTLAIIDFKTGTPKSAKQVKSGIEPQLPLEAAIAARSSFGDLPPLPVSELIYFQFSTSAAVMKDSNGEPLDLKEPTAANAETALAGLVKMIASYAKPDQPYLSRPRVFSVKMFTDYDRLARRNEWTIGEGEE